MRRYRAVNPETLGPAAEALGLALKTWPAEKLFPVLDLARMLVMVAEFDEEMSEAMAAAAVGPPNNCSPLHYILVYVHRSPRRFTW